MKHVMEPPSPTTAELQKRAQDHQGAGEADLAIEAWRRVLELEPDHVLAHFQLGGLLAGHPLQAIPHLRLALEAMPGNLKASRRLAQALSQVDLRSAPAQEWAPALGLVRTQDGDDTEFLWLGYYRLVRLLTAAWEKVVALDPDDEAARRKVIGLLCSTGRADQAAVHVDFLAKVQGASGARAVATSGKHIFFEQDGQTGKTDYSSFRGEHAVYHPKDVSLGRKGAVSAYFAGGLMPGTPPVDSRSSIVAFGSCFAVHISDHLDQLGYNVATRRTSAGYLGMMADGIVNTYAIRQQFEWAWLGKQPQVALWHGYDARELGYDDTIRTETRRLFDGADVFIITLGLSEVWYDEPTGEVFWRAVPKEHFDPARHKFRVVSQSENLENIRTIHSLIRRFRPEATVVLTLSPIPLAATFRPIPCVVADSASKAALRSALDEFLRESDDPNVFYFPSYEVVTRAFDRPYVHDRRHVHRHVLELNMELFERYFCQTGKTDDELDESFRRARELDRIVMEQGHRAAPKGMGYHTRRHRHAPPRPGEDGEAAQNDEGDAEA